MIPPKSRLIKQIYVERAGAEYRCKHCLPHPTYLILKVVPPLNVFASAYGKRLFKRTHCVEIDGMDDEKNQ